MFGSAARAGLPGHLLEAVSAAWRPAPWFAPIAATSSWQAIGRRPGRHTGERLGIVERQERDDRQRRHAPYRVDRLLELAEVVERLDHEEVDAAPFQHGRLLGERREAFVLGISDVAERADRTGDVDGALPTPPARLGRASRRQS